jgi:P2-related tail formation protein
MAKLQVQPSINDTRSQAMLALIERLGHLDLSPLLVYRIASVPASALPFLAWQFDVLSPFWQMMGPTTGSIDAITNIDALTDIDSLSGFAAGDANTRRALLEQSIALHRMRGTPASIKRALAQLGWSAVTLLEGQSSWGGTSYPTQQGWAVFRVMVALDYGESLQSGAVDLITAAVNFFKPARSSLDAIVFVLAPIFDQPPVPIDAVTAGGTYALQIDAAPIPADPVSIAATVAPLKDQLGPARPLYNAHYRHSGITYGAAEPAVADSALILDGSAILYGG